MTKATTCGKYGKMTASKRDALPARSFGMPTQRKYPMPDPAHARNAKARSTQEYNKGALSKRQLDQVHRRADQVIASCKAPRTRGLGDKPKARFEPMPPPYLKGRKCYMDTKDTVTGNVQARVIARIVCDSWEQDWSHIEPAKKKKAPRTAGLRGKPKGGYELVPPPYLKRGKCYMDHRNMDTGKVEARIIARMLCDLDWGAKRKAKKKKPTKKKARR